MCIDDHFVAVAYYAMEQHYHTLEVTVKHLCSKELALTNYRHVAGH